MLFLSKEESIRKRADKGGTTIKPAEGLQPLYTWIVKKTKVGDTWLLSALPHFGLVEMAKMLVNYRLYHRGMSTIVFNMG